MLEVFVLEGIGEITAGDDLAELILGAAAGSPGRAADADGPLLRDGDILAVTSKIVSKAEGRLVAAADREQAIDGETVRVVATREHPFGVTRIVENRQGLVMAAAGVDASNTPDGYVLLLPVDPDRSARELCARLRERTGLRLGVLVTDTAGRAWREGQTDIAIGAAGVAVLDDLRGTADAFGRRLDVTVAAVADEVAGAADLVKGKTSGNPVAVVRGLGRLVGDLEAEGGQAGQGGQDRLGARLLQRAGATDMFRLGTAEAHAEGFAEGKLAGFADGHADGFAAGLAAARAATPLPGSGA
ncbi:coenzyme F420-0:L-glutamate ligase [Glaciibacter sp. 2TAF33]|uniref:coenzyme F420-0:L-glutamate ligase n=1 Tax=Glaciibacter sp. 2TAF33 TaxID=3233015 RepID=UPI003F8FE966